MAGIYRRVGRDGKATWQVKVRLTGSAPQSASFDRKADALAWAEEVARDIRHGKHFPSAQERRRTLGDLLARYADEILPRYGKKEQANRLPRLEYWNAQLGDCLLVHLTAARISEVRERMAKEGGVSDKPSSPATVARYLTVLKHAIEIACREWEWIESNPARRVRPPKEPRGRVRFLSPTERDKLLEACQKSKDRRLYPLVVTALGTGARQGELLRLSWKDIDLAKGTAILHDTKNGERRTLSLQGKVVEVLRERRKVRGIASDLVFANRSGLVGFPKKPWIKALETAKLEDFRFHDLRHTAASYLAMSGATLSELAEILGHKTLAMVKRYAHLSEPHTSKVVGKMVQEFLG